jgi:phage-related baseplate assembly protein
VSFGFAIRKIIGERISAEVDARLSFDSHATLKKAKDVINLYETKQNSLGENIGQNCGNIGRNLRLEGLENSGDPLQFDTIVFESSGCCVCRGRCYTDFTLCEKDCRLVEG